jgi:hypothetical protein
MNPRSRQASILPTAHHARAAGFLSFHFEDAFSLSASASDRHLGGVRA